MALTFTIGEAAAVRHLGDAAHPGVAADAVFAAFCEGEATLLEGMAACAAYDKHRGPHWPYDGADQFTAAARP